MHTCPSYHWGAVSAGSDGRPMLHALSSVAPTLLDIEWERCEWCPVAVSFCLGMCHWLPYHYHQSPIVFSVFWHSWFNGAFIFVVFVHLSAFFVHSVFLILSLSHCNCQCSAVSVYSIFWGLKKRPNRSLSLSPIVSIMALLGFNCSFSFVVLICLLLSFGFVFNTLYYPFQDIRAALPR